MNGLTNKIIEETGLKATYDGINTIKIFFPKEDLLKWDYFALKVEEKDETQIAAFRKEEEVSFIFPVGKELREEAMAHFCRCLDRKYYLVERPPRHNLTVICKISNLCNLDCQYCYDKPFRDKIGHNKKLSLDEIDKALRLATDYAEHVEFLFHGGEPTIVGLDYYIKIFEEIVPKYGYADLEFSIQTNGTLLNDDWFNFSNEYGVSLSSSYSALSEKLRETKEENNEAGDEDIFSVLPKIRRARELGNEIGVIDVMTKTNHKDMIERYEFYKKENICAAFNSVDKTGEAENHDFTFDSGKDRKAYLDITTKYFEHWLKDKNAYNDRYASQYIQMLFNGICNTCNFGDECQGAWIGINSNGDIYPCDRPLSDTYRMGNINEFESIIEIYNSPKYRSYIAERKLKKNNYCKNCIAFDYCKGGCPMEDLDFTGCASKPNSYSCIMMKLNLTAAFRAASMVKFKDLNPMMQKFILANNAILPCEIKRVMKKLKATSGYFDDLTYDRKVKLNSKEFDVFKALNAPFNKERISEDTYSIDQADCINIPDNRIKNMVKYLMEEKEA